MNKSSRKQNIIVSAAAFLIIVVSSFLTYYATQIAGKGSAGDASGYQNVTLTDANQTCHQETRSVYGDKIKTLTTDNHSSRYDEKQFLYKMFLQMDLKSSKGSTKMFHVNCFVRSANGSIRKYEVYEADVKVPSQIDDGTNRFGMPKK